MYPKTNILDVTLKTDSDFASTSQASINHSFFRFKEKCSNNIVEPSDV